jgi:CBS domain-containing protein
MKVKDVMHKGVDWVSPETPVSELAKLMCEHDIGAIPIGENDRLIGMVTDRDIVCKGLAQDKFDARRATARDVMTADIHCCREDEDLAKAVRHMEELKSPKAAGDQQEQTHDRHAQPRRCRAGGAGRTAIGVRQERFGASCLKKAKYRAPGENVRRASLGPVGPATRRKIAATEPRREVL